MTNKLTTETRYDKVIDMAAERFKSCSKCKSMLPVDQFAFRSDSPDGRVYDCRNCTKAYRDANKERISAQRSAKYATNPELAKRRVANWRKTETGLAKKAMQNKRWVESNPEKKKAHHTLNNAIRDGKMERPNRCEECKEAKKVVGHHHDYSKPLDVKWLCAACHTNLHMGEI